jgi:L-rhamnonate dehydratase
MRITRIEPIVLRADVDVSRADGTQDAFLLRLYTDEGLVGIGEADTSPYVAETMLEMPSSHAIAQGFRDILLGQDPLHIDRLWWQLYAGTEHYGAGGAAMQVISAIDLALWDLLGKAMNKPIFELLGAVDPGSVRVYASEVMPDTESEAKKVAANARARGYTALKFGWGPLGQSLDRDESLIRAAAEGLGGRCDLMIDGGRAYSIRGAAELIERTEDVPLYWLEEPLRPDDLDGYRRLSALSSVRIATGEADWGVGAYRQLAEHGVDILQPDLARCGGFTVARELIDLSRKRAVDVVPHCFSTGVLVAASLQFVAALPRPLLSEFSVADSPLASGLLAEPFELDERGCLAVPDRPGLGVELDEDALRKWSVQREDWW